MCRLPADVLGEGNLSLESIRRRKNERTKFKQFLSLIDYGKHFRKSNPRGKLCILKCIFLDQILFMVHISSLIMLIIQQVLLILLWSSSRGGIDLAGPLFLGDLHPAGPLYFEIKLHHTCVQLELICYPSFHV